MSVNGRADGKKIVFSVQCRAVYADLRMQTPNTSTTHEAYGQPAIYSLNCTLFFGRQPFPSIDMAIGFYRASCIFIPEDAQFPPTSMLFRIEWPSNFSLAF